MTSTPDDDALRRRVSAAYDEVLGEPVPDRLRRLLEAPPQESKWTWAHWGGMAASLAIGVIAGWQFAGGHGDGLVVAGPVLTRALDTQLASDSASAVGVQLSFRDRDGRYCRTFSAPASAGLACREGSEWSIVATAPASAASGAMRQAASSLPQTVLDAVDARIVGNALDAAQERAARDGGWKR